MTFPHLVLALVIVLLAYGVGYFHGGANLWRRIGEVGRGSRDAVTLERRGRRVRVTRG